MSNLGFLMNHSILTLQFNRSRCPSYAGWFSDSSDDGRFLGQILWEHKGVWVDNHAVDSTRNGVASPVSTRIRTLTFHNTLKKKAEAIGKVLKFFEVYSEGFGLFCIETHLKRPLVTTGYVFANSKLIHRSAITYTVSDYSQVWLR